MGDMRLEEYLKFTLTVVPAAPTLRMPFICFGTRSVPVLPVLPDPPCRPVVAEGTFPTAPTAPIYIEPTVPTV